MGASAGGMPHGVGRLTIPLPRYSPASAGHPTTPLQSPYSNFQEASNGIGCVC